MCIGEISMTENQHKIIFNKEMTEILGLISLRMLKFMYSEIEKLNLNEREKVMAHYWVIRHYMDGIQKALDEMGIKDVTVEEKI
jgi:hypothetical protein